MWNGLCLNNARVYPRHFLRHLVLCFGRKPGSKLKELKQSQSLGELYEAFEDLIPEKLLGRSERGTNSRELALPPSVTFWAFVWQVMQPQSSCSEVVRKIEAWWRWMQKDRSGMPASLLIP
jgi:hypothetical protein